MAKEVIAILILMFFIAFIIGNIFQILIRKEIKDTYRDGQIDAMNGIIKYKKELQKDSTVIWAEIKQK